MRERYLSILWPLLTVLIAISLWFGVKAAGDNLLKNDTARSGIGSLERAGNAAEAQRIIASWNRQVPDFRSQADTKQESLLSRVMTNQGRKLTEVAKRSLVFDLFFIGFYASAVAVACLLAATEIAVRSRKRRPRLVALGIKLASLQFVTAGFDVIENFALWRMLSGSVKNPWPAVAYFCSMAKFSLLAVSFFYIFLAFGFWMIDHRRRPVRKTIPATP